jgi:hypothetical protein
VRILEIEKLFTSEETLEKVLEHCEPYFNKIDKWAKYERHKLAFNPELAKRALAELGGAFSALNPILAIAETQKKNKEVRFKERLRKETENAGEKYTDSKATTQASAHVHLYRRIRNLIRGYIESADKDISVMQSILKDNQKVQKTPEE